MLMQATDFLELNRRYGCTLQFGGSEQWGNIVNGVDLIRRMDGREAFGLTTPLVTTASGEKMGKTVGGAVWLNAELRSPYDYWQFWRNTEDADVGRFLKLFTELPLDEIARLERARGRRDQRGQEGAGQRGHDPAARRARRRRRRRRRREAAFEEGRLSDDLPTVESRRAELAAGMALAALSPDAGLAASRSEARRLAPGRRPARQRRGGDRRPDALLDARRPRRRRA